MTAFVNHDDKIIFIHTPKTGGTSVTDCLVGMDRCQEAALIFGMDIPNVEYWTDGAHATSEEIKNKLNTDNKNYNDYLSFSIMREPFSWLVSLFEYRYHPDILTDIMPTPYSNFNLFIDDFYKINEQLQSYWFTVDGNIDVNLVLDFDNLDKELNKNFIIRRPLRRLNVNKAKKDHYTSQETIDKARKLLEPDLVLYHKLFGKLRFK